MSASSSLPAPRAHAVPEAPIEELVSHAEELARRWAIALLGALPFDRIAEIPLQSFTREAPALCAAVLRAVHADAELEQLLSARGDAEHAEAPPASRLAAVSGARGAREAAEAIEVLRGVLWEALLEQLRFPSLEAQPARRVAEVADRLAYVCSSALASVLDGHAGMRVSAGRPERIRPRAGTHVAESRARAGEQRAGTSDPPPAAHRAGAGGAVSPAAAPPIAARRTPVGAGVMLVEEDADRTAPPAPRPPSASTRRSRASQPGGPPPAGALPWDIPLRSTRPADARARVMPQEPASAIRLTRRRGN